MIKYAEANLNDMLNKAYEEISRLKEELQRYQKHNARGAGRKGRMTEDDKQRICEMRLAGMSYSRIAESLNLPVGSVFNYSKLFLNDMPVIENGNAELQAGLPEVPVTFEDATEINEYISSFSNDDDIISRIINRDIMSTIRSKI